MARKVNKKFVAILVAGLLCVAVAGAGLGYYYHRKHDPHRLLVLADNFAKNGDYANAAAFYGGAASKLHDPALWVKAAENAQKQMYADDQSAKNVMAAYDAALGIDPTYMPALQGKLNYYIAAFKELPGVHGPGSYEGIRDVATKILNADKANKQAAVAIPLSVIDGFDHNFETDTQKVETAIKQLQDQQKIDPTNADIPYYMSIAYEALARRATRDNHPADATAYNAKALAIMQPAVKAQDSSAAFHLRAAQIYLGQIQPGTTQAQNDQAAAQATAEINRASELVKPDDSQFVEIKIFQGYVVRHGGDKNQTPAQRIDQVTKVYRDALAAQPQALPIRMQLADLLGEFGSHRDEAIDLLKNVPPPTVDQQSGPRGLARRMMDFQVLVNLTNLRLDKLATMQNESEKQVLLGEVEQDYRKIEVKAPTDAAVLRLKAKLQLARNEPGDAIATLDQAIARSDQHSSMHYELMYLEATASLKTNQPGIAKKNLQQIVDQNPEFWQARVLLARTELGEFDYEAARVNLDWLMKNQPNNPEVLRMQIALLQKDNKPDEVKKIYATLPEQNRGQKLDKATIATLIGQGDDAKRLVQSVLTADPGDLDAVMIMSQLDQRNKDTAGALAVIDAALKVKPTNPDLQLQRARLSGSSPEDMRKIQLQAAQNIADPLERELRLFDLTRTEKDESIPLSHLDAAEKANPNDLRVLNMRFDYYLATRAWDKAASYADKLGKLNADKVQGNLYLWRMTYAQAQTDTDQAKQTADAGHARDLAMKLTHDFPVYAQSWVCLGQTLQSMQQFQDAIPAYQEAQARQPENPEPYQGMIDCYYQLNQPTDAGKVIAQAVDRLPTYPGFKELQMQHEMRYGNPEKVIAAREKIVADSPQMVENWKSLATAYESVAQLKATTPGKEAEENTWLTKAKDTLTQAAAKFPDDLSFVAEHGLICLRLKQPDEGEKLWLTALALPQFKDKPQPIAAFADFYIRGAKPDSAEKLMRDYLATPGGKGNADMILNLSNLLANQGKLDAALAATDMGSDPRLQIRKSDILITQHKYADAEKILTTQMQSGKTPELVTSLAFVYMNSNRMKDAMDLLNQALAAKPGLPNALYYRAMATVALGGKLESAIADLTVVRNETPGNFSARYLLADYEGRAGQYDGAMRDAAVKELESIARDDPSQKNARLFLLSIYSSPAKPQWIDAERIAREADANPQLAGDVDILNAEAQMWSAHGMSQKAIAASQQAMKAQPNNLQLVQTYYNVLLKAEQYSQVLDATDKMAADVKDQTWVHSLRGMAKSKLGDKDGAAVEFTTAINQATKNKDDNTNMRTVDQMSESGSPDLALKVISGLPQATEPFWQLQTANLLMRKHQVPEARKALEPVLANLSKLSNEQQITALGFGESLYLETPDPNYDRARDLCLQLLHLTPNDYRIYNNLACNAVVSPADSLVYSDKAYKLMTATGSYDAMVADTFGWNLVQNTTDRLDEGINVLLDAWRSKPIVDIAYHLGEAYLKKNNPDEANKYLNQAQSLFNAAVQANNVPDMTLQQKIVEALRQANDRKAKTGN